MGKRVERLKKIIINDLDRIFKYFFAGGVFFAFDILFFWILINSFHVQYILALVISFLVANSLNYTANKLWSFRDSSVKTYKSYFSYMFAGTFGLLLVTLMTFLFSAYAGLSIIVSRIVAGVLVGIWNYFVNHIYTFKIPFIDD